MKYTDFYKKEAILAKLKDAESVKGIDPTELLDGIKDEMEHTKDPAAARAIATHHLSKDPHYYKKLKTAGLEETVSDSEYDSIVSTGKAIPQDVIAMFAVQSDDKAPTVDSGTTKAIAAGDVDACVAAKTVGGTVSLNKGQKQKGPNHKGTIGNTPKSSIIGSGDVGLASEMGLQEVKKQIKKLVKEVIKEASYKIVSPTQCRCSNCDHARTIQTEPEITEDVDAEYKEKRDRMMELVTATRMLNGDEQEELRKLKMEVSKLEEIGGMGVQHKSFRTSNDAPQIPKNRHSGDID